MPEASKERLQYALPQRSVYWWRRKLASLPGLYGGREMDFFGISEKPIKSIFEYG
jgi:hypothetical protein